MKKKVVAFLLTAAMVLSMTGAAPAAMEETVDISEDMVDAAFGDGEVMFEDEEATDFESDIESEELFSDVQVFSDEEEKPQIEDAQIDMGNAGQGIIAQESLYTEGASFGRQKILKGMDGCGQDRESYGWSWASPESTSYYTDGNGKLHVVAFNKRNQTLYDALCNETGVKNLVKIKMPLPCWGGFYAAPDGFFYVVTGQENLEESSTKTVVRIMKYDRSWKQVGTVDVTGGISNLFPGIYIPFDASSLRMTQVGNILVVHTGREMFEMDGVHHQSNITFLVDTDNMKLIKSNIPYISHSFNQFVVNDGSSVYYLDHGDAYDRSLIISKYTSYGNGHFSGDWALNAFPFMGETGYNYTGCEVTGFALEGDTLITIGKSVPHYFPIDGVTGWDSSMNKNVFMLLTNKNTGATRFFWLTNYAPNGVEAEITEPKMVKVAQNKFAVMFSDETGGKSKLCYALIDITGNLLLEKTYNGVTLQTDSQPILHNNAIYWVSGKYENGSYGDENTYLYRIPVVTVPLTGLTISAEKLSMKEGQKEQLSVKCIPENTDDVTDVIWKSSNSAVASVNGKGLITAKGYGEAVITAKCGKYSVTCKVNVTVPVTDQPLSRPQLSTSQSRADVINLKWGKIKEAKGYQIYYRTSSKASYKKMATLKGTILSYSAKAVPGKTYQFKIRAYGSDSKGKTKYSSFSSVKSHKMIVPAPRKIQCGFGSKGVDLSWSKVQGATGYAVYRGSRVVKRLKASQTTWLDKDAYDAKTGQYYVYDYCVKAYRTVNKKNIYSKATKKVNLWN